MQSSTSPILTGRWLLGMKPGERFRNYQRVGGRTESVDLLLQAVPKSKTAKKRFHLGLECVGKDGALERVKAMNGSLVCVVSDEGFIVAADTEDKEFCLWTPSRLVRFGFTSRNTCYTRQGSGVRGQGSGVRGQGSGVRSFIRTPVA